MLKRLVTLLFALIFALAWIGEASAASKKDVSSAAQVGLVDLNTATADELDGLPGIGATRAAAIIAGRPYSKVDDLVSKGIVSQSIFDKIKGSITVSGAAAKSGGAAKAAKVAPAVAPPAATPPAATPTLTKGQFSTEAQAKAACPKDTVVWVNLKSKIYHFAGTRDYGTTKEGAYMCEADATNAEFRAAKNEKHP